MALQLSVVIPTYNRSAVLRVCLASLAVQTLPRDRFEVLVVDDGSTDDTQDVVRGFQGTVNVRYLRQPSNRGRAAARNLGIQQAAGEVVVFVDSDVFATPQFLSAHAAIHERWPAAVGRGPLLLTTHLENPFGNPPLLPDPSPGFLDTANASVRREHLLAAGGFDEEFRHYGWEDVDLGFRLRRLGLRRVLSRHALAYHYQPPPSPDSVPDLLRREEERARMAVRLLRKHPGLASRFLTQLTPLHRAAAFLLTGGGAINERNLTSVLRRLRSRRLAHVLARVAFNRYYLSILQREWLK
ncbi:MAG: family 2 glycosyl transferase [candidate division GAL15 bacterium]